MPMLANSRRHDGCGSWPGMSRPRPGLFCCDQQRSLGGFRFLVVQDVAVAAQPQAAEFAPPRAASATTIRRRARELPPRSYHRRPRAPRPNRGQLLATYRIDFNTVASKRLISPILHGRHKKALIALGAAEMGGACCFGAADARVRRGRGFRLVCGCRAVARRHWRPPVRADAAAIQRPWIDDRR